MHPKVLLGCGSKSMGDPMAPLVSGALGKDLHALLFVSPMGPMGTPPRCLQPKRSTTPIPEATEGFRKKSIYRKFSGPTKQPKQQHDNLSSRWLWKKGPLCNQREEGSGFVICLGFSEKIFLSYFLTPKIVLGCQTENHLAEVVRSKPGRHIHGENATYPPILAFLGLFAYPTPRG